MQFVSHPSPTSSPLGGTPPLTRSRSSSTGSVTRSPATSSSSGVSVSELGTKMSNTVLDGSLASEWQLRMENSNTASAKYSHRDSDFPQHLRAMDHESTEEEEHNVNGISTDDDCLDSAQRGRPSHQERSERPQGTEHPRPVMERQSSYSKRHSSFNTRREMPYPQGHFGPHSPRPFPSKDAQDQSSALHITPSHLPDSSTSRTLHPSTRVPPSGTPQNQQPSSPQIPDPEHISPHSLPSPNSTSFPTISSHAQDSSARYTKPRTAPLPTFLSKPSSEVVPSLSTLSHFSRQSPSPPLLVAEDIDLTLLPSYPYRYSEPLPPRVTSQHANTSGRPSSLPHALTGNFVHSSKHGICPDIPPPQPPTILTPPPPLSSEANRKPAPHEPFLPRRQPSSDHTYIAVETFNTEYILVVRLPGFQRDAITLAARRRRVLHVVADDWNEDGGHFERRITFGYDADLYNVKAEFDGEFLRIHVPRKLPLGRLIPTQST